MITFHKAAKPVAVNPKALPYDKLKNALYDKNGNITGFKLDLNKALTSEQLQAVKEHVEKPFSVGYDTGAGDDKIGVIYSDAVATLKAKKLALKSWTVEDAVKILKKHGFEATNIEASVHTQQVQKISMQLEWFPTGGEMLSDTGKVAEFMNAWSNTVHKSPQPVEYADTPPWTDDDPE